MLQYLNLVFEFRFDVVGQNEVSEELDDLDDRRDLLLHGLGAPLHVAAHHLQAFADHLHLLRQLGIDVRLI